MKDSTKQAVANVQVACIQIRHNVIGMFKNCGEWYSVVDVDNGMVTIYMVTHLFGLSLISISEGEGIYAPFPDGKTLAEMGNDGLGFHHWCKANEIY